MALNVALAIVCATKPTWNMKKRLERQQECGHQDQSGESVSSIAREIQTKRAQWLRFTYTEGDIKLCLQPSIPLRRKSKQ